MRPTSAGVLTVSDRSAAGVYQDVSGRVVAEFLSERGIEIGASRIVPDQFASIRSTLIEWSDQGLSLVITTGGTGLAPSDITPEATLDVIERSAPGIAELLRTEGAKRNIFASLSRGVAGVRRNTLIVNLPGSPRAVKENLEILWQVLPHALELLSGREGSTQHDTDLTSA